MKILLSYETKESASERLTPTNKSHTVNYDNVTWNKKHLFDEINKNIKENELINWNEIGSRFEIKNKNNEWAKNRGQIAKEFVRNQGIDVGSINRKRKNPIIQRCKSVFFRLHQIVLFWYVDLIISQLKTVTYI